VARGFSRPSSQYLENTAPVVSAAPFSVAAWVRPLDAVRSPILSISRTTTFDRFTIDVLSTGEIRTVTTDAGGDAFATTTATTSLNNWHHAAGVWASTSDRRVFLNGSNKGTSAGAKSPTGLNVTNVGVTRANNTFFTYATADIAELAVWNIALSDEEVALLAKGISPLLVHPESLVAYWPLIGRISPEISIGNNDRFELTVVNGATASPHPPIRYPHRRGLRRFPNLLPVVVTPSTLALTLTGYAPTVLTPRTVTPSTLALALTEYAPTVINPQSATPDTLALALTQYAPSVVIGKRVIPDTPALLLTEYAPTVVNPQGQPPDTLALTLTAYAPAVIIGVHATPDTVALVLTKYAPAVVQGYNFTPDTVALVLTEYAPTVLTPRTATPDTLSLLLTKYAPVISLAIIPGVLSLLLTSYPPTALTPRLVTPDVLALLLTRLAPNVAIDRRVSPDTLALALTQYAPTVVNPRLVTLDTLALLLTLFAPEVAATPTRGYFIGDIRPFGFGVAPAQAEVAPSRSTGVARGGLWIAPARRERGL
jgi:hypothetical protein